VTHQVATIGLSARRGGWARRLSRRFRWQWLLFAALGALLFVLTIVPLLTVLLSSLRPAGLPLSDGWTLDHYRAIWQLPYTYDLVLNTLIFAAGSTVFAIVIAIGLSWLLERTDLPGRNLFRGAILMPMVTPPLLLAIGWALILSPRIGIVPVGLKPLIGPLASWIDIYSMSGMIFVQGLAYVPTAILIFSPVVRNLDPSYEEAALVARANAWQTMLRVSLPFLLPVILSTATVLMIVGMMSFDVPAVLGMPGNVIVMSGEIYRLMTPPIGVPEYGQSAALNSSLFVLLMIGLVLYMRLTRSADRFATISGKGYKATRFPLRRWRPLAAAAVVLYFLLAVVLPFLAVLWASFVPYFSGFNTALFSKLSLVAYIDVLGSERFWSASLNATAVACAAAGGAALLALLVSWVILRSRLQFAAILDVMAMIPVGIPHLMMGVALIFLFFSLKFIPLYGTIWVIAVGHLIVYLPVASRMMQAGMLQIGAELEEAALVARASVFDNIWRIVMPLLRPTLIAVLIWVFVHSLREFSVSVMLQSGRNEVLSTILYSFWENGKPERAAAIAVMLMLCLCALVMISNVFSRDTAER
jgi:iron(III) transport system permease protein